MIPSVITHQSIVLITSHLHLQSLVSKNLTK